jgi:hypothetical protein
MSVAYPRKPVLQASVAACLASAVALMASGTPAAAADVLVPINAITLPNGQHIQGFDISFIDPTIGLYVFADRTNKAVDVFNTRTQTLVTQAGKGQFAGATGNNNTSGPDGVLIVNHKEIWAGDGPSTVRIMSLTNPQVITHNINTGGQNRVDEMCFDPVHQKVMAANNAESPFPFATIFDVATHSIAHQIFFNTTTIPPNGATNGAEQCQWSPRTHNFVQTLPGINNPDNGQGAVLEIDPVSGTILSQVNLPLSSCSAPQGQAMGPTTAVGAQDLIGCNGGPNSFANGDPAVVIDDGSAHPFGTILATVKNQVGSDMVDFNGKTNQYTLARSTSACPGANCSSQNIGSFDAGSFVSNPNLVSGKPGTPAGTAAGNHSIASDKSTGLTFFPVAGTSGAGLCSKVGGIDAQGCILVLKTVTQ